MTEEKKERKCLAVVRIRGTISAQLEARKTLQMLNLTRNNYAVLIEDDPALVGMVKAAKDFITWGEASRETVALLLSKRGRLSGNKKITDEYVRKLGHNSLKDLAEAVFVCGTACRRLPNVQGVFRLHPPTKGFKGNIKKSYGSGGELGYRGAGINELIRRMA